MMINKRLINLCKESKLYIGLTILVNWMATICNIITIFIIGKFINNIFVDGINYINSSKREISIYISIIVLLVITRVICNILYSKFSSKASSNARIKLREKIYEKLLKLGTAYMDVESTSGVVQVSVEGIEQLEIYFGRYLPQFFYSLLVPVTLFIFMSFISIKASLVFILAVPLIPISIIAIMKIAKKILKDYWKSYADLGGSFLDNLQGLTTLKVFNVDEEKQVKMNEEAESFRKITMKVLSMQLNSITIMDLVAFGGAAAGTIVALIQFKNGNILVGDLLIIILLSSEFFIPLRLLGSYFHIAMNGMAASDKMFKLLDAEERKENTSNNEQIESDSININVNNVGFTYDNKRQVLKNINMNINKGGVTAIVGESGSGKSTIASLILNNYKVSSGEILINNKNINDLSFDTIYKTMTTVSTNSYIFNGTILDNLLIAKRDASEEEINKALKKAKLLDFVHSLEKGILTNVGQEGNLLSGGQKQRLALARAILADRKMIIFDEATSNIDIESEESIWKTIYEISKEKTVLVISHRLANVKDAKEIYVMNNGELVEHGSHYELVDKEQHYYKMLSNQNELELIREV